MGASALPTKRLQLQKQQYANCFVVQHYRTFKNKCVLDYYKLQHHRCHQRAYKVQVLTLQNLVRNAALTQNFGKVAFEISAVAYKLVKRRTLCYYRNGKALVLTGGNCKRRVYYRAHFCRATYQLLAYILCKVGVLLQLKFAAKFATLQK